MDTEIDIMDTSWMEDDQEDMNKKVDMKSVTCYFVYVNTNNIVDHVMSETCALDVDTIGDEFISKIPRNHLLGLIQTHKIWNNIKYRLMDILQYDIPYDFTGLLESSYSNIMKTVTTADEIMFKPSLSIFHKINSIFFVYQEIPKYWDDYEGAPIKPALKISDESISKGNIRKKTKRVSFKDLDLRHTKKARVRFS
jgi:hypothetical protein